MSIARLEKKAQQLRQFILHYIVSTESGPPEHKHALLAVVRSVDSPLLQALASLAGEMTQARVSLRMIVAQADPETFSQAWRSAGAGGDFQHEVRWARNPRLIEAHEQLVLGPHTCWIGDSMRRDPAKSDAYESYVEDCGEAAGCAAVSFERLWAASDPLLAHSSSAITCAGAVVMADAADDGLAARRH
ncbi:MAG TPA: hypothetical protein VG900_07970 [Hyphomicrobiaceae bacterium]|nr:hypothetical protein [Hyphomicrobiaceae bacterium]